MINASELSRSYGDFLAVDQVSFEIGAGQVVGLLGHNGAGKSTIMRMLTGYLEPDRGDILIAGENLLDDPRRAQRLIGYLPENCPVYPEMTVVDFLDYTATLRGIEVGRRPAAIRQAIERTGLTEKALARISTLSRGYRQRAGVAQAILHQPQILILDEPTNGLDPEQIAQMRKLICTLGRDATVIVSTHILQEVEATCERVLILRSGKLALDARLDDLTRGNNLLLCSDADPVKLVARLRPLDQLAVIDCLDERGSAPYHYRLTARDNRDALAAAVAAHVVAEGWNLFALQPEDQTLEKVFHELTVTEVTHAA